MTTPTVFPQPKDRIVIPGYSGQFEVMGMAEDMCHSPFWAGPIEMPTPYVVGLIVHANMTHTDDGYGNQIESWAEPVDFPVCGWQTSTKETHEQGRDKSLIDLELLVPGYVINLMQVSG